MHSWVWPENDQLPKVVYVKFDEATWQLDGIDEPGVYPIHPITKPWYLDKSRQPAVLLIRRTQIPLTPAYAMTAHSSQGKTLPAVLLDLNVEQRVDTTFGTVAASRVRSRYDCLILRPFPRWLFNRGASDGPGLLLQTLRGEHIDWAAYREGRLPFATCSHCQQVRTLDGFEHQQWDKVRANCPAMCMRCKHGENGPHTRKLDTGIMKYVCSICKLNKIEDAYPRAQLKAESLVPGAGRKCLSCCRAVKRLQCCECGNNKDAAEFHASMLTLPSSAVACKACQEQIMSKLYRKLRKSWFTCRGCGQIYPTTVASEQDRQSRCLNCASRGTRQKDEQTCKNKSCKRKWHEKQIKGQARKQLCPDCRGGQ